MQINESLKKGFQKSIDTINRAKKLRKFMIIFIAIPTAFILYILEFHPALALASFGAITLLGFWFEDGAKKSFARDYKKSLINSIIEGFDDKITYKKDEGILSLEQFNYLGVFEKYANRYSTEDYLTISREKYEFEYCEIEARYYSSVKKSSVEIFKGSLFRYKLKRAFNYPIYLRTDTSMAISDALSHIFKSGDVELEEFEFENSFKISCEDMAYAKELISEEIVEAFSSLSKETKRATFILLDGEYVYIFIRGDKNRFEPKGSLETIDSDIKEHYEELEEIVWFSRILEDEKLRSLL